MDALVALWEGAFGSPYAFLSATLVRATPLLFVGLAVSVAFRAGVLNIGAEGQLLAGATAGALWAAIAALLRRRFGVLEVISTIMLNFVALHFVSWLIRGPLQEPTLSYPQSETIVAAARWPLLIGGQRLHLGSLLAFVAALLAWWVFQRTAAGFRARIVGAGPRAAASAEGVAVERTIAGAFLVSGALAGLAGASEVGGVTWALYEGISPGYGYTAIAVALLARLDPKWVIASAIFFGALDAGSAAMQRDAGVPAVVGQAIVAVVILGVLATGRARDLLHARRSAVRAEGL